MNITREHTPYSIPHIVSVSRESRDFIYFTEVIKSWGRYDIDYIRDIGVSTIDGARTLTFLQADGIHKCPATKNEQTTADLISSVQENLTTITVCLPYGGEVVTQSAA